MALILRCIGVDRHLDDRIPDLNGARRDATALWALITDTLGDIDAKLIVDEAATSVAVRQVLADSLSVAGPEDDVVVVFAGHGTHDHRLVTHDTNFEDYETTTISMTELAELFRATRARSAICILDCCFSGAAPARVLDGSPTSRDLPLNPQSFAGAGRVMITAAKFDEPVYEHPQRRHGLLTYALITVLTRAHTAQSGSVSLASAMDDVLAMVRAEAAAMGCTQTPVLFGLIEGGLTMPTLRAGTRYFAAFPEAARPIVGAAISDLAAYRLPQIVLEAWTDRYPQGLNELQVTKQYVD